VRDEGVVEVAGEAAGEVLAEEDDSGGILVPSFASRRCEQALGAGGAVTGALLSVRSECSEAAHRRQATTGQASTGAEQSSEEVGLNGGREEQSGWWLPL
jgi:hypothetical protein